MGLVHTGTSFNTGTENTMQVSKFKRIGFEKKMADFDGGESYERNARYRERASADFTFQSMTLGFNIV